MAAFDGPWEVRLFYTTQPAGMTLLNHRMTFDVNVSNTPTPGTSFGDVEVTRHDNSSGNLSGIVDGLVEVLAPLYAIETIFNRAELWHIPESTYDALFVSSYLIGMGGEAAPNTAVAQQQTLTFRTVGGGVMRVQMMEPAYPSTARVPYPTSSPDINAVFEYVIGPTSAILGRDNTRPFAPMNSSGGQNEALARKRYRSS